MERKLTIKGVDNKARFTKKDLEINSEDSYMNDGVAFMGLMKSNYVPVKVRSSPAGLNTVETEFVKYLYKIRNANYLGKKVAYTFISGPNDYNKRERVFIAGHIFPYMNLTFRMKSADATKIEVKALNMKERSLLFGEPEYKLYGYEYISIDNDTIRILLPTQNHTMYSYKDLLFDFLTNGEKTKDFVKYGEFPDKKTCELAHNIVIASNTILPPGCWLTKDRKENNDRWKEGCEYILKYKLQGVLAPFSQIADFYEYVDSQLPKFNHNIRWTKGAKKLVNALKKLEGLTELVIDNDVEVILSELNLGICDFAITQFYELFYGKYKNKPLTILKDAYEFDKNFVEHEQGTVAPPIYSKTPKSTIETFQAMTDEDANTLHGLGAILTNDVTPEFDDPWGAEVTDSQFRIDLPLLMLWLDKHKPTANTFKDKVDKNGYLLEKYKKVIRKYEPIK